MDSTTSPTAADALPETGAGCECPEPDFAKALGSPAAEEYCKRCGRWRLVPSPSGDPLDGKPAVCGKRSVDGRTVCNLDVLHEGSHCQRNGDGNGGTYWGDNTEASLRARLSSLRARVGEMEKALTHIATAPKPHGPWQEFAEYLQAYADRFSPVAATPTTDAALGKRVRDALEEAQSRGDVLVIGGRQPGAWLYDDYACSDVETDATRALASQLRAVTTGETT